LAKSKEKGRRKRVVNIVKILFRMRKFFGEVEMIAHILYPICREHSKFLFD
jgi:hypothetical protein